MSRYICTVCGYVYEEEKGIPEAGTAPGTKWEALPEDWVCPLCGAAKSEFRRQGDEQQVKRPAGAVNTLPEMTELTALEMSALCSNLAKGCEKQYRAEDAADFTRLAEYFKGAAPSMDQTSFAGLLDLVEQDLSERFPQTRDAAAGAGDRGALRALTWSEKVSRILKSLLARYEKEGESMLENTGVYVCTICGFIYVGDTPPDLCPVCKVPSWKFEKIEGRA